MMRTRSLSLGVYRRLLFVLALCVSAIAMGGATGCGDDDPVVPGVDTDAAVEGGARTDAQSEGGTIDTDGAVGTDSGTETGTDATTEDASDADAADAEVDAGPPTLSIDNVTADEGSTGATSFTFTVSLSSASTATVTVNYATADGTASSLGTAVGGADFTESTGTLTFSPGDTSKTVTVAVNGDSVNEANETFTVVLSSPTNAPIGNGTGTGTITNDDTTPTLSIADALIVEGNTGTTAATFVVTLSAASGQPVTVTYKTTDGTATAGSDYTAVADTVLTFAPGETSKNVVVDVTGDTAVESNELFTVDLSAPTNATIVKANGTGTIQNDDGVAQPSISINDPSVAEGNAGTKVLTFAVTLSAPGTSVVTVDFATADGTATVAGTDYQATTGALSFALGETSKNVSVVVVGDTANENDETFTVTLANAQNAIVSKAQGTGTITNDDAVPTLVINDVSVAEGQAGTTSLSFTATLSAASGKTVTASFATADGTANSGGAAASGGQDYTAATGTVTFLPGTTTQSIVITVAGDTLNEQSDTLTVTLSAPVNATLGAKTVGTGTINNDDAVPSLVIEDVAVSEGNAGTTDLVFTVSLVNATSNPAPSGRTITVNYATSNGTAVTPSDYVAAGGTLTFDPGQTQATFVVQANGDTAAESNETFNVALSGANNAAIQTGTAVGTIQNDDGSLPLLNIGNQTVVEGNTGTKTLTFTVTLSAPTTQAVTVDYATADGTAVSGGVLANGGQDYIATNGTLTFAPGEVSKPITVTTNTDVADEANETFDVVLSNVSNTAQIQNGTGVGTLTDDDATPTLAVANAAIDEGDAGSNNLTFVVTLSAASGRTVTVSFDTADNTATTTGFIVAGGTDYTATSGTLVFAPGEITKNISVPVTGDTTRENNETMTVTLSGAVNAGLADANATGTITNDDAVPTVSIADVTLAEGTPAPNTANTTQFVFTITLSNTRSVAINVVYATANGTATGGGGTNDFSNANGTVTFAPGESTKTVTVLVRKDAVTEATENFFVNLNASTNSTIADGQAVGTITNDD